MKIQSKPDTEVRLLCYQLQHTCGYCVLRNFLQLSLWQKYMGFRKNRV